MTPFFKNYEEFLKTTIEEYSNKANQLLQDSREDEANLYKVKINICEIFSTMIHACNKKVTAMKIIDEVEKRKVFSTEYLKLVEKIPTNWNIRLTQAKKANDIVTVTIEEAKLATAQMLKEEFLRQIGELKND